MTTPDCTDAEICYSTYVYRLAALAERLGARVRLHAHELPPSVAGVYRVETREIFLNEPSARGAVLALAHEIGHHVGHALHPTHGERERQAYVYGWRALRLVDAPVTRAEWIAECADDARLRRLRPAPPPTEHLYR